MEAHLVQKERHYEDKIKVRGSPPFTSLNTSPHSGLHRAAQTPWAGTLEITKTDRRHLECCLGSPRESSRNPFWCCLCVHVCVRVRVCVCLHTCVFVPVYICI